MSETTLTEADLAELRRLATGHDIAAWIAGRKSAHLDWSEIKLACAAVQALPALIAEVRRLRGAEAERDAEVARLAAQAVQLMASRQRLLVAASATLRAIVSGSLANDLMYEAIVSALTEAIERESGEGKQ